MARRGDRPVAPHGPGSDWQPDPCFHAKSSGKASALVAFKEVDRSHGSNILGAEKKECAYERIQTKSTAMGEGASGTL